MGRTISNPARTSRGSAPPPLVSCAWEAEHTAGSHVSTAEAARGSLVAFGVPGMLAASVCDAVRVAGHYLASRSELPRYWALLGTDERGITVVVTDYADEPMYPEHDWLPYERAGVGDARLHTARAPDGHLRVGCRIPWPGSAVADTAARAAVPLLPAGGGPRY